MLLAAALTLLEYPLSDSEMMVTQLMGVSVVVVVTGPVQIGHPAQVDKTMVGSVPPTQHPFPLSL